MSEQTGFWFAHAKLGKRDVGLAVAAYTERSARVQARKFLGPDAKIGRVDAVKYAHAWPIDFRFSREGHTDD